MDIRNLRPASQIAARLGVKCLAYGDPGSGKCLGRGTLILMFNGDFKAVEDIKVGDLLMGPDSKPRTVLSLARGKDRMYEIIPVKGESFICNEPHILSLIFSGKRGKGEIFNVPLNEYLQMPYWEQKRLKAWRTPIDFPDRYVPIDPYFLGLWLGDGDTDRLSFHTIDKEIVDYLYLIASSMGINIKEYKPEGKCPRYDFSNSKKNIKNPALELFKEQGLIGNKHVPHWYKVNSREIRLQILAGILDTDGSLSGTGFDFISKLEVLADDVCFLARSLGLAAYKKECKKTCQTGATGDYFRVSISGDCSIIPTKLPRKKASVRKQIKNVLLTGIDVEYVGIDEYFGFELTGDKLFVLSDFTVTHNTPVFGTAPNPILLLVEPGARSLSKFDNLPTWEAYTYPKVVEFFEWWMKSREVDKFDTLGIDSVSHMAEVVLTEMLRINTHGLKAYGEMSVKIMAWLNFLYFQPQKHMYLICKQTRVDEGGTMKRRPFFPGNDLNVKVPHMFDLIMHLGLHNIPGVVGPQKAFCTSEQYDLLARDRSGQLNMYEPPNLTNIFEKAMR